MAWGAAATPRCCARRVLAHRLNVLREARVRHPADVESPAMKKGTPQPSIFADPTPVGRSLTFRIAPGGDVAGVLRRFRDSFDVDCGVVGIGEPAVLAAGGKIGGLRTFPSMSGAGCAVPSTQGALWVFLRGADRGVAFDHAQEVRGPVAGAFVLEDVVDTFCYRGNRDLTRFEDGTENPHGERAIEAAVVAGD
jgi:porphyrinogen peroxidase